MPSPRKTASIKAVGAFRSHRTRRRAGCRVRRLADREHSQPKRAPRRLASDVTKSPFL